MRGKFCTRVLALGLLAVCASTAEREEYNREAQSSLAFADIMVFQWMQEQRTMILGRPSLAIAFAYAVVRHPPGSRERQKPNVIDSFGVNIQAQQQVDIASVTDTKPRGCRGEGTGQPANHCFPSSLSQFLGLPIRFSIVTGHTLIDPRNPFNEDTPILNTAAVGHERESNTPIQESLRHPPHKKRPGCALAFAKCPSPSS